MVSSNALQTKPPKPILMKLGMVEYVWDPTRHDKFGGAAQRGWSG